MGATGEMYVSELENHLPELYATKMSAGIKK
jgi:hypothetical protein